MIPRVGDVWEHKERAVILLIVEETREWSRCLVLFSQGITTGRVAHYNVGERHFRLLWRAEP